MGLEVFHHPSLYPLGWVNIDVEINVINNCIIRFIISVDFTNIVELDVVPLDVCGVVFSYMYMRDAIFM